MVNSVSVIGLGKLGAPMAACFAASGLRVTAVDVDAKKVDAVNRGLSPVNEPGLGELIRASGGRLRAMQDIEAAVRDSEVTFIVVATPSEPGGGFSLRYALPSCEAIGKALRAKAGFHLVVLTSTVMPGSTGSEIRAMLEQASGKRCGEDFGLCYNPEFIALGTVIRDFYNPDFVLIGESDLRSGGMLEAIYKRVCKNSPLIARMNFVNAEITKLAVNTYVTTKISFANMLARLCEKLPEADVNVVTGALGLDSRIGPKYLKGAVSYGGPCFPRDNRAFAALAQGVGATSDLAQATDRFNRAQIKLLANLVRQHQSNGGPIGILGLTYKPDTDVMEESFGLLLAQELANSGVPVVVHDPSTTSVPALSTCHNARIASSAEECVRGSDVVVVATPWKEYRNISTNDWSGDRHPRTLIDCWRFLENLKNAEGVRYVCLGSGSAAERPVAAMVGVH